MPLRLTYCGHCTEYNREFTRVILQLQNDYPEELRVVELECMAACGDGPIIMLDYDFYSRVTPQELDVLVRERLAS